MNNKTDQCDFVWAVWLHSHGLRDAHVALGRLRGDTASGNQRLHWLVEEHAAGNH